MVYGYNLFTDILKCSDRDLFTYLAAGQVVGGLAGGAVHVALPGGQNISTLYPHI